MDTQTVSKERRTPTIFNDLFKPWDEWFDNGIWFKTMNIPSVNIKEEKDHFIVSLAAPGLKRSDFKIKVDENLLTISSEKEHEEKEHEEHEEDHDELKQKKFQWVEVSNKWKDILMSFK